MSHIFSDEFVKGLIRNVANKIKLERLKQPFSMLPPAPFHFQRFSKLEQFSFRAQQVEVTGLEVDALHEIYGLPRDIPQMILTLPGIQYGQEFADFTVEMFGLQGNVDQPDEIGRLNERAIGDDTIVSNVVDPDSLPFGAGCCYTITERETGKCVVKIHVWRWRVFMDNSSLCLENNWHRDDLIGGGWIPFILGIVYENPEKMVKDAIRFAPAFRLCNLVKAELGERRGGAQYFKINPAEEERRELGRQYIELKVELSSIRSEYNRYIKQKKNWRAHLRTDYPSIVEYPDVLEKLDDPDRPKYTPSNLATEIAARRSINTYKSFSVTAKHLKELMILPSDNAD